MIQDRILCKSKLTLLKCDLAKKFKEIQDSVLDDGFSKNHIDLKWLLLLFSLNMFLII